MAESTIIPTRTDLDTNSAADVNELSSQALDKGGSEQLVNMTVATEVLDDDLILIEKDSDGSIESAKRSLLVAVPPINSFITQYTDSTGSFLTADEPGTLFSGTTWVRQFSDTDGVFFKNAGDTDGQTRVDGVQPDQLQEHIHDLSVRPDSGTNGTTQGGASSGTVTTNLTGSPSSSGTLDTPRTGDKTEPLNREMKVWKRTA